MTTKLISEDDCFYRARAEQIAGMVEDELPEDLSTDQLGDFWQHLTEACLLRLVRLKPEMVRKVS